MRVKSLLMVIVMNIFLMLFASVLLEYVNLSERFQELENTFQIALDSAIGVAAGSEEMFTDEFQRTISSFASDSENSVTYSTTLLYRSGEFHQVNSYALAYFYKLNGRLPRNLSEIRSMTYGGRSQELFYFERLYGTAGSDYPDGNLSWANTNNLLKYKYSSATSRRPSAGGVTDFVEYFKNVGRLQRTAGYLKKKFGTDEDASYTLEMMTYPTLANMGFTWMSNYMEKPYTSETSEYTIDNFSSSLKIGKSYNGLSNTKYFLTPMSLGVTYLPVEVLKPCMAANLDTLVRLNALASGSALSKGGVDPNVQSTLDGATECVPTSVYKGNGTYQRHHVGSNESIITDGNIEYDLNSLRVKVDYFFVNFGDGNRSRNEVLVSKLEGCLSYGELNNYPGNTVAANSAVSQSSLRAVTLQHFLEQDTALKVTDPEFVEAYKEVKDGRIVARVSAKIKIHVPYQSGIMQWMCERSGNPGHYDIKVWNPSTGRVQNDSDGLWYMYTTYYMQSRV